jgi:hypothetical protein
VSETAGAQPELIVNALVGSEPPVSEENEESTKKDEEQNK